MPVNDGRDPSGLPLINTLDLNKNGGQPQEEVVTNWNPKTVRDDLRRAQATSVASTANRRWIPPSSINRDAFTHYGHNDIVFRKVRGVLNKLTPEKFRKLSDELLHTGLDSPVILKGVILLIFEKALEEPKYSSMYAQLCRRLCEDAPNFEQPGTKNSSTFRRLLLSKCQDEFENRSSATEAFEKKNEPLTAEEEDQRRIAKRKMLGNIKFVGELGKLDMLHESILHKCIRQLLERKKMHGGIRDTAEDLECLCQIMRTVGRLLDTDKARSLMDQYFNRIRILTNNEELPARIRFMLQDVLELRESDPRWVPRKFLSDHGPKTIQQVREEAAKDFGYYIPPPNAQRNVSRAIPSAMRGNQSYGGMDDVFACGPTKLGAGPGVIATEMSYESYTGNGNRNNRSNNIPNSGTFPASSRQGSMHNSYSNRQNNQEGRNQGYQYSNQQPQQLGNSGKEVSPRFLKKTPLSGNFDEISLRPAKNSMIVKPKTTNFSANSGSAFGRSNNFHDNNYLPPHLQPSIITPMANSLHKESSIVIKPQKPSDKNKANKKEEGPTRAEVMKLVDDFLPGCLQEQDLEKATSFFKDLKAPKIAFPDIITLFMTKALEKSDAERDFVGNLFVALKKENMLGASDFMDGFKSLLQKIPDFEVNVPRIKSHMAGFSARAVIGELVALADLAEPLENGSHYPLFLLCMQQLHMLQGKQWLHRIFNESKVDLLNVLPEIDRSKDKLMNVLDDRCLSFLFPLLRLQADLWKQIQLESNPAVFYKWIKENVDVAYQTTPGFINTLVTCLLKYVTSKSTLGNGVEPSAAPDKMLVETEKDVLEKYKPIFQTFLHEHMDLQVVTLYALQVYCYQNSFPKGMLLRWYMMFYAMEIIEEEAFLKWKEDVTDQYPGKGKALFQVNQWLTWLEEAEEEDEDSEDGDD